MTLFQVRYNVMSVSVLENVDVFLVRAGRHSMLSVRVQTSELQATPWWTHRRAPHSAGVFGKRFRVACCWWADKGYMCHLFGRSGVPNLNKRDEYGTGSDSEDIEDQGYMEDMDVDALVMCVTIVLEGNHNRMLLGCVLDPNLCSF